MFSLENPRLAGYNLLGNRWMFLKTDGCLAWLYHCPLVHLPFHSMNQSYHKNPIDYESQIQFVDPITWQTNPAANSQIFTARIKKLCCLDMDQEDSSFIVKLSIRLRDQLAVFGRTDSSPVAVHFFLDLKMLECTLETKSVVFGTVCWSVPPLAILRKKFLRNIWYYSETNRTLEASFKRLLKQTFCWQNDFTWLLQRSVYGFVWTSCVFFWTLWNLLFSLFIFTTRYRCCGYGNAPGRNI